jgi:hypothetical protein
MRIMRKIILQMLSVDFRRRENWQVQYTKDCKLCIIFSLPMSSRSGVELLILS